MCLCVCFHFGSHFYSIQCFYDASICSTGTEEKFRSSRIIKYDSTSIGKHLVISFHSKIHFLFFRTFFFGQKIITIPFIITTRITRIRRILFNDAPKHLRATYIKGENIFTSTNWPKMSINQWKDQKISASGS